MDDKTRAEIIATIDYKKFQVILKDFIEKKWKIALDQCSNEERAIFTNKLQELGSFSYTQGCRDMKDVACKMIDQAMGK